MINLPLGLRNAIDTQECVLFIGAGVGSHFIRSDGTTAPNGKQLCEAMCTKFAIPFQASSTLAQISEVTELRKGRKELESFISSQLGSLTPDETFRWISTVRWRAIYTTNYDNCIERAYQLNPSPPQNPVSFSITSDMRSINTLVDVPIYHVHGYFLSGESPNIIVTRTDYARFRERRRMLFERLKAELATASFLYVGYSNSDPNWELLLEETIEDFLPSALPQSYRIDPYADDIEAEILAAKNIVTVRHAFQDFVAACVSENIGVHAGDDQFGTVKEKIPPDLRPKFNTAPAPILRLLSAWEYVNQAQFNDTPNLKQFLKGDIPNWSLISERHYFERDVQEELYDMILDFATTPKSKARALAVVGSAGYGISTLLRSAAVEIVREEAGAVFYLRPQAKVVEGDLLFAASLFDNVFFVIDNGPQHASAIERALHLLKESSSRAMILVGARLNEWHQCPNRPRAIELPVTALSDPEIDRILSFLSKHNALAKLADLPYNMQFNIIKERHHKELLVVMSEATENNNFDAIIESEYRGISGDVAKLAYLYVCGFYQHGAHLRDDLLAELLGCSITELYATISTPTEGVIVCETIDENKGIFGSRARHHKIAAVVWERCADASQKESLTEKMLKGLNLNYGTDALAFDQFVRSDRIVDSIRRLEGRIAFFEHACKMDPTSPYVRQHYARMLGRSGEHQLALQQIDNAINKNKNVRVLFHTKGKILTALAKCQQSIEMGRKYLIQAESCFNMGINLNTRDDYGFESLASLYFDWSKKLEGVDDSESLDYLSKAEETLSYGLKSVRNRESLWILSSKMALHFGEQPDSVRRLENAVNENRGAFVARYVLARAYRAQNEPQKAIDVLEPVINAKTDEFRSLLEYSLALLDVGESYQKALAVLRHGTLYGLSDARFIAVFGGMHYLDGNFDEADRVFEHSVRNAIPADELFRINFRPSDPRNRDQELRFGANVVRVRPGFSILKAEAYPQIVCPASKYHGALLEEGARVSYALGFSAKGPLALAPNAA